jgi:hypothetical protein
LEGRADTGFSWRLCALAFLPVRQETNKRNVAKSNPVKAQTATLAKNTFEIYATILQSTLCNSNAGPDRFD